jgi:hypothetical protein
MIQCVLLPAKEKESTKVRLIIITLSNFPHSCSTQGRGMGMDGLRPSVRPLVRLLEFSANNLESVPEEYKVWKLVIHLRRDAHPHLSAVPDPEP